jgi:tetratricopeptide (TPR) repeat protein
MGGGSMNRKAFWGLAALFLFTAFLPAPAARAQTDDARICTTSEISEEIVAACTRAIGSGKWQGKGLAWAYTNRGVGHERAGNYERAVADHTVAIRLDPELADGYLNRGISYRRLKKFSEALADYTHAIKLDPNGADIYSNRGNVYSDLGNFRDAIEDYNRAIQIDPNYYRAYNNRGLSYESLGDKDRAIADFRATLRIDPNHENARANLERLGVRP